MGFLRNAVIFAVLTLIFSLQAWAIDLESSVREKLCELSMTETANEAALNYSKLIRAILKRPKDPKMVPKQAKKLYVELKARVRILSDEALRTRATAYIEQRVREKGYLPGLTPDFNINTLDDLLNDRKKTKRLNGSALDNVVRNLRSSEMSFEYFMLPEEAHGDDLIDTYRDWAEFVEAAEVLQEISRRYEASLNKNK